MGTPCDLEQQVFELGTRTRAEIRLIWMNALFSHYTLIGWDTTIKAKRAKGFKE